MEKSTISCPIYLLLKDCGEVITFSTQHKLQGHLEAIDVENNEYEAWDADGRVLALSVGPQKSEWLEVRRTDQMIPNEAFAEIKTQALPYRDPQRLLRVIGRKLGLLKAEG
jgi:hypothetical protein